MIPLLIASCTYIVGFTNPLHCRKWRIETGDTLYIDYCGGLKEYIVVKNIPGKNAMILTSKSCYYPNTTETETWSYWLLDGYDYLTTEDLK